MKYHEGIIKNTEFFTTTELADKLKMNVQVITRKIQSGEILAFKIGKDWRVPEQSVHEWLQKQSNVTITGNGQNGKTENNGIRIAPVEKEKLPKTSANIDKKKHLLEYILAQFEPNRPYSETEIKKIVSKFDNDFSNILSNFLDEKMMERQNGHFIRRPGYRITPE